MRSAIIENGIVKNIIVGSAEGSVECIDEVSIGWTYGGGGGGGDFAAPVAVIALDQLKEIQIAVLTSACAAAIISGYSSSALGTPHVYPSKQTDQINMMGSVTAALLPDLPVGWSTPFWCEDSSGDWAFRAHTVEQILQAGSDGKAHVVDCQTTLASLNALVAAAETAEAVAAIVWPSA